MCFALVLYRDTRFLGFSVDLNILTQCQRLSASSNQSLNSIHSLSIPGDPNDNNKINDQILEDPTGLGFTCALCGKGFGLNRNHCRRHIKNIHSQSNSMLPSDLCKKCYKNKDSLRHHQRTTHGLYQN